jgi:hypothetical protein
MPCHPDRREESPLGISESTCQGAWGSQGDASVSRRTLTILWIITGLVALLLAAATLRLAARSRSQALLGRKVYLTGRSSGVQLHQEPDLDSPIVAVLVRGSTVTVLDSVARGDQTWYRVQKADMTPGWVPDERISTNPP